MKMTKSEHKELCEAMTVVIHHVKLFADALRNQSLKKRDPKIEGPDEVIDRMREAFELYINLR